MKVRTYLFYNPERNVLGIFFQENRGFYWKNGIEWSEKAWASFGFIKIGFVGYGEI